MSLLVSLPWDLGCKQGNPSRALGKQDGAAQLSRHPEEVRQALLGPRKCLIRAPEGTGSRQVIPNPVGALLRNSRSGNLRRSLQRESANPTHNSESSYNACKRNKRGAGLPLTDRRDLHPEGRSGSSLGSVAKPLLL